MRRPFGLRVAQRDVSYYLRQLTDASLMVIWVNTCDNYQSIHAFKLAVESEIERRRGPNPNNVA